MMTILMSSPLIDDAEYLLIPETAMLHAQMCELQQSSKSHTVQITSKSEYEGGQCLRITGSGCPPKSMDGCHP